MAEILNDLEVEKVCGGALTEEAKQWFQRNMYEVVVRLGQGLNNLYTFNNLIKVLNTGKEYDVGEVKQMINEYCNIDVSDLI